MTNLVMFTTEEELSELTGLNYDQLLEEGFYLSNFCVGFYSGNQPITTISYYDDVSSYEDPVKGCEWLVHRMDTYCMGYIHKEYDKKHYYMVYTS